MSPERTTALTPPMQAAVEELQATIAQRYPAATFEVGPGEDEPEALHLVATVDVDDPDEVMDLVVGRLMQLQAEDNLPLYVIPVRTPERIAALRRAQAATAPKKHTPAPPAQPSRGDPR